MSRMWGYVQASPRHQYPWCLAVVAALALAGCRPASAPRLVSADGSASAYGKLFTHADLPNVIIMAARLPPPPAGQACHVWLTRRGQTRLAGLMAINERGFGLLVYEADQAGPVYEAAQLRLQPESSRVPSGVVVLSWEAPD